MKFFLPFWFSDHIYSSFDPWKLDWEPNKDKSKFIWQLDWPQIPVDGILISRNNIEKSRTKSILFQEKGIYETLHVPPRLPTFGDCGAWGYIKERAPPYDPIETLEFYRKMKFTFACTVDHIILPETFSDRFARLEITLRNAKLMKDRWDSDRDYYDFELVGVVQGWDAQSYYDSAKEILDLGYSYVALGGQSRSPSRLTVNVLEKCHELWKKKEARVHIFGLARSNLMDAFRRFGISSFDNAYHRRAWLSTTDNYQLGEEKFTAIRIPITIDSSKAHLERKLLELLRELEQQKISISRFLDCLVEYDTVRAKDLLPQYERTLKERPWTKCQCLICKSIGIHVVVFRSNERNMRRGFHNLWNFHSALRHNPISEKSDSNSHRLVLAEPAAGIS